MNIPIYRAKIIDKDEYVEGWLKNKNTITLSKYYYPQGMPPYEEEAYYGIDPTTLSIHFPNMKANNHKIFASLREDGRGGDMLITENHNPEYDIWESHENGTTTAIFNKNGLQFTDWYIESNYDDSIYSEEHTKFIGIQK